MSIWPPPTTFASPAEMAAEPDQPVGAPSRAHVAPAFEAFFREQVGPMVRLARLITGSAALGEEIAQDAFCEVYKRWASLDEPVGYLYRSVVNRARSHFRREEVTRRGVVRLGATAEAVDDAPGDVALRNAVAKLNDRQRAAVVLKFWADLPEKEIASILSRALAHPRPALRSR